MIKKILNRKKLKLEQPATNEPHQPVVHHTYPHQAKKQPRKSGDGLKTLGLLLIAPLIAVLLVSFVFRPYEVDGPSMETTLSNNDRLIISKVPRTWAKITGHTYLPDRGEIIVFNKDDLGQYEGHGASKQLIKRVIGLPGDRVVVNEGRLTIYNDANPNGFLPDETYGFSLAIGHTTGNIDVKLGVNEIFVCGDNRRNSLDSRTFGPINATDIVGKVSYRILPLGEAKKF